MNLLSRLHPVGHTTTRSGAHPIRRFLGDDLVWTRVLAWVTLAVALAQTAVSTVLLATGRETWGFALVGGLCSALIVLPFLLTETTVFSLWGPVALVVTLGTGVRGLAMATGVPSHEVIQEKFVRGRSFGDLAWPSVVAVLSIAAVVVGYTVARRFRDRVATDDSPRLFTTHRLTPRNVGVLVTVMAVLGAVGTLLYLRAVGGLAAPINERRTVFETGGNFQSFGHWEFLARFGVVALLTYWASALSRRRSLRARDYAIVAVLVANAFAINVVTTTRTDVLYVTLGMLMIYRLVRGKVSLPASLAAAVLVLAAIGVLSDARSGPVEEPEEPPASEGSGSGGSGGSGGPGSRAGETVSTGVSSGILNRNGYDLSKTLVVVDAVPDELPYAYGGTITRYVLAPIPRALWPDKPAISEGVTIGRTIYGLERTGIPPGLTGELVWNFGRELAVVLSLLVGLALGLVERAALRWPRDNVAALVLNATVVLLLGKAVLGVSTGQALSSSLQTLVLLSPLLALAVRWRRRPDRVG